eukprot:gene22565-biopygen2747
MEPPLALGSSGASWAVGSSAPRGWGWQGETATPAYGPRPVRVRFFKVYRAPRVRSASGPRPLPFSPEGTGHWRRRGVSMARAIDNYWLGVARAWRGHVLFPHESLKVILGHTGSRCMKPLRLRLFRLQSVVKSILARRSRTGLSWGLSSANPWSWRAGHVAARLLKDLFPIVPKEALGETAADASRTRPTR